MRRRNCIVYIQIFDDAVRAISDKDGARRERALGETMTAETLRDDARAGAALTIALCFAVAVLEGFDIQAMGVAAPKLGPELHLDKATLGEALSASNIGLVLGASLGGWLADKWGRKPVLIGAVLMFGVFTIGTMSARALTLGGLSFDTFSVLFAVRFGAGLGFGAALPNLMAMSAEVAPMGKRGSAGAMMFCGMPAGGGTVALISWLNPDQDWRTLFLIGGLAPLAIAPALYFLMRETRSAGAAPEAGGAWWQGLAVAPLFAAAYGALAAVTRGAPGIAGVAGWLALLIAVILAYAIVHRGALFREGRTGATLLLWVIFVPTLMILYLILNWLPTLVAAKGFARDASQAAVWFNWGSVLGALALGRIVDRFGIRWPLFLAFAGLIASLLALAQAVALPLILVLSGLVGVFLLGANYALYGAAASYYPRIARGRGSGAAVAWGRFGAVLGPLAGGYLLAGGASAGAVVQAMIPFAAIAGLGVLALSFIGRTYED
jgi:AAHS family 3-hydroxyphenylpropionic acid transporter